MSAAVVASRSITGHSVAGVNRIALTRSIRRETASDDSGVAPGACDVEAPGFADWADEAGSAARFAPQLPQNVASSAIVVPHFGQFMSSAPSVETMFLPGHSAPKAMGVSTNAERATAGITRIVSQRFFDSEELVPLRHAFTARKRSDLDLPGIPSDREMCDRHVFTFAGARRHNRRQRCSLSCLERRTGFGQGARLIGLDQRRIAELPGCRFGDAGRIR